MNLLLLAASIGLFFLLVYPLLHANNVKINLPQIKTKSVKQETDIIVVPNLPMSADYIIVTEKNLFHPERRMLLDKKEEEKITRPDIVFYGSIITDDKKIAYIEDKKNPYVTPGRGKRQTAVRPGAIIGGYVLKEVNAETLVLVRGNDKMVVNLRDQKDRSDTETAKEKQPGRATSTQIPARPKMPARSWSGGARR